MSKANKSGKQIKQSDKIQRRQKIISNTCLNKGLRKKTEQQKGKYLKVKYKKTKK